jgi:SRSO17 transposase
MLPHDSLPATLTTLLTAFQHCFTAPTFANFTALAAGMVRQTAARTVCGMLTGARLEQTWPHSRAHWFFSHARWSTDALGLALADLIVDRLIPADTALTVAIDDTLFHRSGKKVHAVAWCHDRAAKAPKRSPGATTG